MLENFTRTAKIVLIMAREESEELNHNYIGTEHLLLALARAKAGVAANVLQTLGIDESILRQVVEELIGVGGELYLEYRSFTPRAKAALGHALAQANHYNDTFIDSAHLLAGLTVGRNVAEEVLAQLGITLTPVRERLQVLLSEPQRRREP